MITVPIKTTPPSSSSMAVSTSINIRIQTNIGISVSIRIRISIRIKIREEDALSAPNQRNGGSVPYYGLLLVRFVYESISRAGRLFKHPDCLSANPWVLLHHSRHSRHLTTRDNAAGRRENKERENEDFMGILLQGYQCGRYAGHSSWQSAVSHSSS